MQSNMKNAMTGGPQPDAEGSSSVAPGTRRRYVYVCVSAAPLTPHVANIASGGQGRSWRLEVRAPVYEKNTPARAPGGGGAIGVSGANAGPVAAGPCAQLLAP